MSDRISRSEGRVLFGRDSSLYDEARPGNPERVFELLVLEGQPPPGRVVIEHDKVRAIVVGVDRFKVGHREGFVRKVWPIEHHGASETNGRFRHPIDVHPRRKEVE